MTPPYEIAQTGLDLPYIATPTERLDAVRV